MRALSLGLFALAALMSGSGGRGAPAPLAPPTAPDRVPIPAGCFVMGAEDNYADERPPHRVCLSGSRIDRTEVTVAAFARCVAAGRCTAPVARPPGAVQGASCNGLDPQRGRHPVNCVTWEQARTYCAYRGARLPTEAEWERAARGAGRGPFPWGSAEPSCGRAVLAERVGEALRPGCGTGGTLPVGSRPGDRSAEGVLDLAGNVSEWTADWYAGDYYKRSPSDDPQGPRRGRARVVRGGSFRTPPGSRLLRSTARQFSGTWDPSLGFRCAEDAPHRPGRRL